MKAPMKQDKFLSNEKNKTKFISMLCEQLKSSNIGIKHAEDDADVLIVKSAIESFERSKNTIIVGEDVDLLVLLIAKAQSEQEIFFLKPGRGKIESRVYSSKSFDEFKGAKPNILLLHAISGCDTTSAMFQIGKKKVVKLLESRLDLQNCAQYFKHAQSNEKTIIENGTRLMLAFYNAPQKESSLDTWRYNCFIKATRLNKPVKLSSLPPTSHAAQQHLLRVFLQVQKWLDNNLNPENWGWSEVNNCFEPIKTFLPPAPDVLLNTVFCNCKKGCNASCTCRKLSLYCSHVCGHCRGLSCFNSDPKTKEISDLDKESEDQLDKDAETPRSEENSLATFYQQ